MSNDLQPFLWNPEISESHRGVSQSFVVVVHVLLTGLHGVEANVGLDPTIPRSGPEPRSRVRRSAD